MVETKFKAWKKNMFPRKGKEQLPFVKEFERFLREPRNLKAEEDAGSKTLKQHAKLCPDLNAIENVWDINTKRMENMRKYKTI